MWFSNVKPNKNNKPNRRKHKRKYLYFRNGYDDRQIFKGLKSLNRGSSELHLIFKLNDEPRIELTDRLKKFNEFANNLNIKLLKGPKNCILNTAKYISNENIIK